MSLEMGSTPQGVYQVYLYVYEPNSTPSSYSVRVEGVPVLSNYSTGTQYSWSRIGPFRSQVTDGSVSVEVLSGDYVYIYVGGIELHRELQAPPPPATVRAGADLTLPEYTASYTLRGAVDRITVRSTGYKSYELKDHLGNVRVVVSDHKQAQVLGDGNLFVRAAVRSFAHYYPFGMAEPGGTFQAQGASAYRYGYNGKELDREFQSNYDYGFRIYNAGIAKFLSVDPLAPSYPMLTVYQFASNSPISSIDVDGLESLIQTRRVDYRPVMNSPDVLTATKNVAHNSIALAANTTVGPVYNTIAGVVNFSYDLFNGKYNNTTGWDVYATVKESSENAQKGLKESIQYYKGTPFKQQLSDHGEALTNLETYEGAASLLFLKKLNSSIPKTATSVASVEQASMHHMVPAGSTDLSKIVTNYRKSLGPAVKGNIAGETGSNVAVFEYMDNFGKLQTYVTQSAIFDYHTEKKITLYLLEGGHINSLKQISRVYTERQPCTSCTGFLNEYLPNVRVTYSFPYGSPGSTANQIGNAQHSKYVKDLFKKKD